MMKPKKTVAAFTTIFSAILVLLIGVAVPTFLSPVVSIIFPPQYVHVEPSPAGHGTAFFYEDSGMSDTTIDLFVKDPAVSQKKRKIGLIASRPGKPPKKAVWSRDGSVVAVLGSINLNQQDDTIEWSDCYDFSNHRSYSSYDVTTSNQIVKLLNERGGKGKEIDLGYKYSKVWPWDANARE